MRTLKDTKSLGDGGSVWFPISTAPKDGTEVLGWSKRHGFHVGPVAPYKRPEMPKRDGGWFQPTHWMPLPSIPNNDS